MIMQQISNLSIPSPSRPTTVHSRRLIPDYDSSDDYQSHSRSYTILHDTDGGSGQESEPQTGIQFRVGAYDQVDEGLLASTGRTSPTCVPSRHSIDFVETVEPSEGTSQSSPPLSAPQGDFRQSPVDRRYMSLLRNWRWEVFAMVTSMGLLAAIIITLGRYNHSQQPEWPFHININSLASVVTALIVAQLGFILAETISQLKWSWFKHPHLLQDLQDYDAASRGMIGSLKFLGRFASQPRAYLAVGAALVFTTLAAIGPFTQQSIKSYACQRALHNVTASIPAVNWINSSLIVGSENAVHRLPNFEMMAAALEGIVGSANDSLQVPFDCPTGNCDFEPYSSLAYCSTCVDTTSYVQEALGLDNGLPDYWNYTLPVTAPGMLQTAEANYCQLRFNDASGHPRLGTRGATGSASPTHLTACDGEGGLPKHRSATSFNLLSISWANCSHDHDDGATNSPGCGNYPEQLPSLANTSGLVAMSCTLGLCVRDYTAHVRNGVLDETTTGRLLAESMTDDTQFRMPKLPCILDKIKYDRSNISQVPRIPGRKFTKVVFDGKNLTLPRECVYKTDQDVPWAINEFLGGSLFQIGERETDIGAECGLNTLANASWCDPWYLGPLFHNGRITAETISADMDSIARSISNRMRVVGSNAYRNGSGFALGTAIQTTVCVKVDWPWLILPGALVLLTGVMFAWVIISARHAQIADGNPIWKSSALVAFFHGIDARLRAPNTTDGGDAGPAGSPGEAHSSPSSTSSPRPEAEVELMSLKEMHAKAKRVMVKLETAAPGQRGFILVSEEQDKHRSASKKQNGPRRSASSEIEEEALSLTQLPSHSTARGQCPTFLQVDLGTGFAPSVRNSLDRSRQPSFEDSIERSA